MTAFWGMEKAIFDCLRAMRLLGYFLREELIIGTKGLFWRKWNRSDFSISCLGVWISRVREREVLFGVVYDFVFLEGF